MQTPQLGQLSGALGVALCMACSALAETPESDQPKETESAPPETTPSAVAALDVESILSNPLDDEDYQERSNCLPLRAIDKVEVLDDTLVVFQGRGKKLWLNQLSNRCLGLREDMLVELRAFGGSICRLDRFVGRPRFSPLGAINAQCRLGSFETIDELQVEALRTAIEERRRAEDMARKTEREGRLAE